VGADLDYALSLADAADELTLTRFRAADLRVETKADLTPVTDADRAVERLLRERIARDRPGDGVLGEEEGDDGVSTRWIIDPIDGTRNFSRGIPVWATLLAYERDGVVVCGVASAPALGQRWWAERGSGAFRNGDPLQVSGIASLADASVAATHARDFTVLEPLVWHARGFGDFWQHMLVAEGGLDAAVDADLAVWDYGPLGVIVEEAGGRVTSLDGEPPSPGAQVVSSNGVLHGAVLEALTASAGS
jgi:histidinol-phosphatase